MGFSTEANNINNGAYVAAAAFNFTLTLMTAGRIWWVSYNARKEMGKQVNSKYTTIVAIIIESGFLYSASLLGLYITMLIKGTLPAPFDPDVIMAQLAGLAPTLLIVRATSNKSADSVYQSHKVFTITFASVPEMQGSQADRHGLYNAPAPTDKANC
ncbi:hypothetical protein V5O48_006880 [Marasmius crinis-equi]|uniref:Uncharacterized protein n=1 Tax=Marasmius crinis-equi TaxID=585013 RepID=A0ABR3FIG9_9AGAR